MLRNRHLEQGAKWAWQKPQCANERKLFINWDHSHEFTGTVTVSVAFTYQNQTVTKKD